jgi:hypothetical protein
VDVYVVYAASALAANTIVRSAVAAAFPLFTVQMFDGVRSSLSPSRGGDTDGGCV